MFRSGNGKQKIFYSWPEYNKLTCSTVFVWKTFPHEGFVQSEKRNCIKILS